MMKMTYPITALIVSVGLTLAGCASHVCLDGQRVGNEDHGN